MSGLIEANLAAARQLEGRFAGAKDTELAVLIRGQHRQLLGTVVGGVLQVLAGRNPGPDASGSGKCNAARLSGATLRALYALGAKAF
jgi:hypothetical protein